MDRPADEPRLREISPKELRTILADHRAWLDLGETTGERADLSYTDLRDADLLEANLSKAYLEGADLGRANLQDADLTRANLRHTDFSETNLRRALLHNANLRDADLTGARGLIASQLTGSILAGAKLPEAIARFEALDHIKQTVGIAVLRSGSNAAGALVRRLASVVDAMVAKA